MQGISLVLGFFFLNRVLTGFLLAISHAAMSMSSSMHQQLHQLQGDCSALLGKPFCARVRQARNAQKGGECNGWHHQIQSPRYSASAALISSAGRKHNVVAQAKQRASAKAATPSVEALRKENELLRKTVESTEDEAEPAAPAASQPKGNGKQAPAEAVPAESTLVRLKLWAQAALQLPV